MDPRGSVLLAHEPKYQNFLATSWALGSSGGAYKEAASSSQPPEGIVYICGLVNVLKGPSLPKFKVNWEGVKIRLAHTFKVFLDITFVMLLAYGILVELSFFLSSFTKFS